VHFYRKPILFFRLPGCVWLATALRDLGSTPILVEHVVESLDKALYDDYLCLVASNKQQIKWKEVKKLPKNSKLDNSLSGCGFVQNIAPPSLSRNGRIKMEQNKTK